MSREASFMKYLVPAIDAYVAANPCRISKVSQREIAVHLSLRVDAHAPGLVDFIDQVRRIAQADERFRG